MEDEDVLDSVTKINPMSIIDNKSPSIPICKEVDKGITTESSAENCHEETSGKNFVKLKNFANHQEIEESGDKVNSDFIDVTVTSPKKMNGEVSKCESNTSEDDSNSYQKTNEKTDVNAKSKEKSNDETENLKRRKLSIESSDELVASDEDSENKTSPDSSPVEFRGFKRRKLLEAEEEVDSHKRDKVGQELNNVVICPENNNPVEINVLIPVESDKPIEKEKDLIMSVERDKQLEEEETKVSEPIKPKVELRRSARNANMAKKKNCELPVELKEENGDQLTEYAQYLGLQPTVKFKCGRCGEKHFQSMASLNSHQKICSKSGANALMKPTKPSGDSNLSTNFRITRKVYLCSACGTYYENWKLFLHMREMHKRHICLFCLGMFSVADKLAEHLLFKHNVHEKSFKSPEEFLNLFKGSYYLTCCSCEKMFTERDDFFDHQCKDLTSASTTLNKDNLPSTTKDSTQRCNLCGILCGHFQSCPNVRNNSNKIQNSVTPPVSINNVNSPSSTNISLTKFYIPVPASVQKEWNNSNVPINTKTVSSNKDDFYDLGNAASFCHIDMANDSDTQLSSDKLGISEGRLDSKEDIHQDPISPSKSTSSIENCTNIIESKNVTINEVLSSSDESVPEKNENMVVEKSESSDKQTIQQDNNTSTIKDFDNDKQNEKKNEENYADDEHNSSEDDLSKTLRSIDKLNTNLGSSETDDYLCKKSDENLKDNSILPCYIVLNRVDERADINKTKEENLEMDVDEKIDDEENEDVPPTSSEASSPMKMCLDDTEDICSNDGSPNLKGANNLNIETCTSNQDISECSDRVKTSDVAKYDNPDKRLIVSDEKVLSNQSSSLVENGFEGKENDLSDKSDESEDSDKLSVVISEDGYGDKENKTEDCSFGIGQDNTLSETNSNRENKNCITNESLKQTETTTTDDAIDFHNGSETVGDSFVAESQNNSTVSCKDNNLKTDCEKIQLANEEITAMALTLEDKMDNLSSQFIIKECVRTSCTTCSFCSHAVKIGVNGKQLALHLLAEHRYMPVKNETVEDVVERLKKSLEELQDTWFNTDSYDSSDKSCFVSYDHTYECFQCNYVATLHKDLCSHKRKVHQKSTIYCCMCKANFHSYSELLCHMCPGLYVSKDIQFRCCLCELDRIPSAFRLMVHLRKTHHTCDICLEIAGDQQKLSTHMWKHKLHHLCYRCGISYRNKPDITKHLFWKHGTESVLCKKCLQKKWPHVYHFCIPPTVFICEECNLSFSKAVALKVHKRLHSGDFPYACISCDQKFVSKKLLLKHEKIHNEITAESSSKTDILLASESFQKTSDPNSSAVSDVSVPLPESANNMRVETENADETPIKQHKKKSKKDKEKKPKPVVDVYDLPPLNLSSESDDSDDEKEIQKDQKISDESQEKMEKEELINDNLHSIENNGIDVEEAQSIKTREDISVTSKSNGVKADEPVAEPEENAQPIPVLHGIWDSFHSYKAEQEKRESLEINKKQSLFSESDSPPPVIQKDAFLGDHDYCKSNNMSEISIDGDTESEKQANREHSSSIDHDYCTLNNTDRTGALTPTNQEKIIGDTPSKKKQKTPKKKVVKQHNSSSSSDSSSDSDSSTGSCSCGTNCSCTSSSSNSSSSSSSDSDSSSSEGRRHISSLNKREKKRDKLKTKRKEDLVKTSEQLPVAATAAVEEDPIIDTPVDVAVPEEPVIKESDLETDETSTDEEFYDQNPQRLANQLLAEKRNQLMGSPAVLPVNNGSVSPSVNPLSENLPPPSSSPLNNSPKIEMTASFPPEQISNLTTTVHPQNKKKVKSKKRKKSTQFDDNRATKTENLFYTTSQPSTSFSTTQGKQHVTNSSFSESPPNTVAITNKNPMDNNVFLSNQQLQETSVNSETHSSKRLSKRRRIRNKFYGYSSEDEDEPQVQHPSLKWKKPVPEANNQHQVLQQQQQFYQLQQQQFQAGHPSVPEYNFSPNISHQVRTMNDLRNVNTSDRLTKTPSSSGSSSSSSSSNSEMDTGSDSERTTLNPTVASASGVSATTEKIVYCYCKCPYDEVSEMIACDGANCKIEWFHFECVGIMVPPKGKWYCPDCRKNRGL